jgi:hypothetical protein
MCLAVPLSSRVAAVCPDETLESFAMNIRKLAARALTLSPVAVLAIAGFVQVRAQVARSQVEEARPVTFLVQRAAVRHRVPAPHPRPKGAAL